MDSKLFSFHNFDKTNLVTNMDGTDSYVCKDCGLKGKRFGVNDFIELTRPSKMKLSKCNGKKGLFEIEEKKNIEAVKNGFNIEIINDEYLLDFGLKSGDKLETVEYPKDQEQGLSGVWVMTPEYNQPVRITENEYRII